MNMSQPPAGPDAGNIVEVREFADINFRDSIFDSIRVDYPEFSNWVRRCQAGASKRRAFVTSSKSGAYGSIAVVKLGEGPKGASPHGLKISTFKVASTEEGSGRAGRLLEAIIQYAYHHKVVDIFITVPPGHEDLVRFLERAGFRRAPTMTSKSEYVYTLDLTNHDQLYPYVNRLAFDALAAEYEVRATNPGPSQDNPTSLVDLLIRNIRGACSRLLELGPGAGIVLAELQKQCDSTIGVELSPEMARLSARRSPKSTIVIANARDVDFPVAHFDGIFAGAFLHLFPSREVAHMIAQMAKWTRPGGAIFVNTSVATRSSEGLEDKLDYARRVARFRSRWSEAEFQELLTSNGLRIIERATTDERERNKYWVAFVCEPTAGGE